MLEPYDQRSISISDKMLYRKTARLKVEIGLYIAMDLDRCLHNSEAKMTFNLSIA